MYYPYLRAKQFELKALREFSEEHSGSNIVPILEPVKKQSVALERAVEDMMRNKMRFALVLNPTDGDFKHDTVSFGAWLEESKQLLNGSQGIDWIPAFICTRKLLDDILSLIEKYQLNNVMLVFKSCMDMEDPKVSCLVNDPRVEFVVNAFGAVGSRRLNTILKRTGKKIIRLDDCFKTRTRNADYALEDDELFSEEPFYYMNDGYDGFSDYTTLPSDYVEGGVMPYAVAIHLSYKKDDDRLNVHHFVSDSNESNTNVRGKFHEAACKIEPFFEGKEQTSSVKELISKAEDPDGYPGLGYLKKLSVKNHLELIASII